MSLTVERIHHLGVIVFLFDDAKVDIFFNSAIVEPRVFLKKKCVFIKMPRKQGRIPLKKALKVVAISLFFIVGTVYLFYFAICN